MTEFAYQTEQMFQRINYRRVVLLCGVVPATRLSELLCARGSGRAREYNNASILLCRGKTGSLTSYRDSSVRTPLQELAWERGSAVGAQVRILFDFHTSHEPQVTARGELNLQRGQLYSPALVMCQPEHKAGFAAVDPHARILKPGSVWIIF